MMYFVFFVIAAIVVVVTVFILWGVEKIGDLIGDFSIWLQKVMR